MVPAVIGTTRPVVVGWFLVCPSFWVQWPKVSLSLAGPLEVRTSDAAPAGQFEAGPELECRHVTGQDGVTDEETAAERGYEYLDTTRDGYRAVRVWGGTMVRVVSRVPDGRMGRNGWGTCRARSSWNE